MRTTISACLPRFGDPLVGEGEGPGVARSVGPPTIEMAASRTDEIGPLEPLAVADAFENVTLPKSARGLAQPGPQVTGRSTTRPAED